MQFETVEGIQPGVAACASCQTRLAGEYHELNGQPVCAVCRSREEALYAQDQQWSRFVTAAVYGGGAALVGALLYWGFVKLTNFEFGLMAIAVGWLVGRAVMKGSNMRGGRRYQILALVLTYLSITLSYGALIVEEIAKGKPAAAAAGKPKSGAGEVKAPDGTPSETPMAAGIAFGLGALFLLMLASPFLAGFSNVIGWVIIAIGLYEAWKHTRAVPFSASGPHRFGTGAAGTPAPAVGAE